jgi:Zn-dependent protease/CBS domain-containing protein
VTDRPQPTENQSPRGAFRIGRFFGVPLYLSTSWFLIAVFVTIGFADLFRNAVNGATGPTPFLLASIFAVLSATCVLLHELGHVATALALGLRVNRVLIFLLGGISEIDPEPDRPGQEFLVSAAGPLTSAALAGLAWLGTLISTGGSAIEVELDLLLWSNLVIAVFNALPGLPLDGGRVLRSVVWGASHSRLRGTTVASWGGRVVAVVVLFGGLLVAFDSESTTAVVFGVGFATVMAGFLWIGASQSLAAGQLTDRIPTLRAAGLMRRAIWIPAATPVATALRELWQAGARAIVVLDNSGRPTAIVDERQVDALDHTARLWKTVGEVAHALQTGQNVSVTMTGHEVLAVGQRFPTADLLVIDDRGTAVGVLSAHDLRTAMTGVRQ